MFDSTRFVFWRKAKETVEAFEIFGLIADLITAN